jgi:hypothetical protein
MAYPNAPGQYHLFVDAALGDENNSGGLGAVLMQDQEAGLRKPVAYASRRLDKHEQNYPVFLAEMQAAVFRMEQFHHFLITGRFALYTDHWPLCKLSSVHVKRLNRLQLKMTELHPNIKYIEGKNNYVADFLSRYHGMNIHVTDVKYEEGRVNAAVALLSHKDLGAPVKMVDASPFRVRVLQDTDTDLKPIKDNPAIPKSTFEDPAVGKSVHCRLPATIIDNILYVRTLLRKGHIIKNNLRMAVPAAMRKEILTEAHNSWIGGHGERFKTTERLRGEFWWPGMDADIDKHVATCVTCQAAMNKNTTNPPPLVPLPEPRGPNRRVHCDLWGPVRSSTKKNTYIMVVTDAFTKFATAIAIPGKEAMHVAPTLLSHFYTLGIPLQLVTDQGREYCKELEKHLWTALKIRHDVTTPYHPACNSAVETINKILKHYIATAQVDAEASTLDWEAYLAQFHFAYNTAVSSSTKVTPFEATFGYD